MHDDPEHPDVRRMLRCRCAADRVMSDVFFLIVGMLLAGIGLLLFTASLLAHLKCSVSIQAVVIGLEKEYTHIRGSTCTQYRPVVQYAVAGKVYTEKANFRTSRKEKYPPGSRISICFNPRNPQEVRFAGHVSPLPMGLAFLFIGAILVFCFFL